MSLADAKLPAGEPGPYARHLPALDGIRGLAILGVMGSHLFVGNVSGNSAVRSIQSALEFGATGVDLFFALSGFLITGILFDSLADRNFFRKFYARRCLRIFPLYYGTLLVLILLTPWTGFQWNGGLVPLLFYLQNTNLGTHIYTAHPAAVPLSHFWSLAVEEQFYLVWPLLVFLLRDVRKLLWACFLLTCLSFALRYAMILEHLPYIAINTNTLCRADSLLSGGALALLLRSSAHDAVLRAGRWLFLAGVIALLVPWTLGAYLSAVPPMQGLLFTWHYSALALASTGLIDWSLSPSLPRLLFRGRVLRFFGKYSYGLYVLHLVVFPPLRPALRDLAAHISTNKGFIIAASGIMAFWASVLVAYASYNLYEKQFLRLKRYFEYTRPVPATVS